MSDSRSDYEKGRDFVASCITQTPEYQFYGNQSVDRDDRMASTTLRLVKEGGKTEVVVRLPMDCSGYFQLGASDELDKFVGLYKLAQEVEKKRVVLRRDLS